MARHGMSSRGAGLLSGVLPLLLVLPFGASCARTPSEENAVPGSSARERHTNHLIHEKSPYLLQHAHNPVNWYPWGEEALTKARQEDKPIFLSIGYSTCHWCHVMERESFENEEIAALLNEHYVAIKVDREERPDLDEIYMNAVQAMTGQGGWPLSVWLTPDLKPFYGGTYFPPDDRFGRPGFRRVLVSLADAYTQRRGEVETMAGRLLEALQQLGRVDPDGKALGTDLLDRAYDQLKRIFDAENGGWGRAPKFPRADFGAFCLRQYRRTHDVPAVEMVTKTLRAMARGGMFDHLGGGFHRYSTDERWLVPHFEKMLYDNAQLAFHYLEAYQLTGDEEFARVARRTLDYVLRDMTDPAGGFYSAEDADSEGEEGRFYVWTLEQIQTALPDGLADLFVEFYGVTEQGNWEGKNILEQVTTEDALAAARGQTLADVRVRLEQARAKLLAIRDKRVRPGLDDKVLTAWNGLMIAALARGAVVLDEPRYLAAAERAADFVWSQLRDEGGLLRRWREGEAAISAYSEDYAFLVRGLLELYQSGFRLSDARRARQLHDELFEKFGDRESGGLYNTLPGQHDLLVRVKTGYDGSVPTANSVATANAIALFELTGEDQYARQAEGILKAFRKNLEERPTALVTLLLALDSWLGEREELVLAGAPSGDGVRSLQRLARSGYHPDLFLSLAPRGDALAEATSVMPPLEGKVSDGAATAYLCRSFTCRRPTSDAEELRLQLQLTRLDAGVTPGAD